MYTFHKQAIVHYRPSFRPSLNDLLQIFFYHQSTSYNFFLVMRHEKSFAARGVQFFRELFLFVCQLLFSKKVTIEKHVLQCKHLKRNFTIVHLSDLHYDYCKQDKDTTIFYKYQVLFISPILDVNLASNTQNA